MGANTNLQDRLPARLGLTETEVFSADDLPAPSGGVITLPTGLYNLKNSVTLSDRLEIETGATVKLLSEQFDHTLTYSGTDTFISSSMVAADFRMRGFFVFMTGVGSQFIDLCAGFLSLELVGIIGLNSGQSVGAFCGTGLPQAFIFFEAIQIAGFASGMTVDDADVFSIDGMAYNSLLTGSGTLITMGKNITRIDLDNPQLTAGPSESALFIDPALRGTAVVRDVAFVGSTLFYEAGDTGTITAFADAAFASESITSVSDSSDVARFNFSAPPTLFVNQEVTISGYTINTDYNVTGIITATGAGYFEISSIDFGTNEAGGSFVSDTTTATSAAHGQSEGGSILISGTINYDGGFTIYNALTDTFQINRAFVITETDEWNAGSLTETDPRVKATDNPGQKNSMNIGSVVVVGNTAETTIAAVDTWTDLNMNGLAVAGSNIELWTLIDVDTGEIRYDGLESLFGSLIASIAAISTGGPQEFQFRVVKNGSPLSDAVVIAREFGVTQGNVTLLAPITVDPGDLLRLQTQNVDGSSNIEVNYLSLEVT